MYCASSCGSEERTARANNQRVVGSDNQGIILINSTVFSIKLLRSSVDVGKSNHHNIL